MFKFFVVASLFVAQTCALPQQQQQQVQNADATASVVSNTYTDDAAGNFNYAFEISNGIKEQATGQLKDINVPTFDASGVKTGEQPGKGGVQQGSYSYISPDGTPITLQWVADEVSLWN